MHDTFISYATEDERFAGELAGGLMTRGISVWYAPLALKIGDRILDGIEKGLRTSHSGTIIVSKSFLQKKWTNYELDILIRQAIEREKPILQIWHGVTKEDVDTRYMGLTGMLAMESRYGLPSIINKIAIAISDFSPLRATVPETENPVYRFLNGSGKIQLSTSKQEIVTLFQLLLDYESSNFPIFLEGHQYSRKQLAIYAKKIIAQEDKNQFVSSISSSELEKLNSIIEVELSEDI